MGPMKLYFDVRDIFRAPRMALSGKKIFIFSVAGIIGYAAFLILSYLALMVSGTDFSAAWNQVGLYPFIGCSGLTIAGKLLYWIGSIILFFAITFGCTAVARVTYKQLKGDEFYSAGDSFKYLKKHWHPVIFTAISFALILLFFLIGAAFFALWGQIPYVGEFLFVLPYLLYFFGSVFTVYTAVVFLISFLYTPAIIAAYEEDTMGAVFQSYSITWSQPWRIVLYHLVLLPIGVLGIHIFKFFWFAGYKLVNIVFGFEWLQSLFGLSWFSGAKLAQISNWAWAVVNPFAHCASLHQSVMSSKWCDFYTIPAAGQISGSEAVAGTILAIFLFILIVSVVSYGLSILSVGEVLMFVIFKKKTDDDNLLERKDEDDLEKEEEDEEKSDDEEKDSDDDEDETPTDDEDESSTVEESEDIEDAQEESEDKK